MPGDTPKWRAKQHRPSARTHIESMKLLDRSAWRPADPGSEFESLVARATEYWARSTVNPNYLSLAAKLARRCLDLLSKLRGGEDWQRLRTFELNSRIYQTNSFETLEWINAALEPARDMENLGAIRRLLGERAKANYGLLRMRDACRDLEGVLATMPHDRSLWIHTDYVFALVRTVQLATYHYFLGEFIRVKELLHSASDLLLCCETSVVVEQAASIRLLWANIHRLEDRPHLALQPAKQAAHEYELCHRLDSKGQTHYTVAQIALDLAWRHPEGTERDADIDCAIDHTNQTRQLARDLKDKGLGALAAFSHARIDCARKQPPNQHEIERIIAGTKSPLLLAQAWMVMGTVFGSQEEPELALMAFHKVQETLKGSDVPAFGVLAQRAVFRYDQGAEQWWQ